MTPLRAIRIDTELWQQTLAKAREQGTTATAIVIAALRNYIK